LLRKIVSRIKGIFKTPAPTSVNAPVKASKSFPSRNQKETIHEKPAGTHRPRERKRETREEYAARHARLEQRTHPQHSSAASQRTSRSAVPGTPASSSAPVTPGTPAAPAGSAVPAVPAVPAEKWNSSVFKVPVVDGKTRFQDFELPHEIMHAIYDLKFQYCTPVQAESLIKSLSGDDVTAQAQTGTGKTAAYLIAILDHLLKHPLHEKPHHGVPRALILAPTRELVMQIERDAHSLGKYTPCRVQSVFGGMNYTQQEQALKTEACDIIVATPGRLLDFMKRRLIDLSKVEILILDEADRMLDMGFISSVRSIVLSTPPKAKRQTMFFSATISPEVRRLAESWTRQAFDIAIMPDNIAVDTVEQITFITTHNQKPALVYHIIMQKNLDRVLMFVNRRDDARRVKELLQAYGVSCALLSGDVDQKQRVYRLERFREGKIRVLVATDVASRGLHIEGITHVINYNMPTDVEEYVHRIGRTGRAGAKGIAVNFAAEDDAYELVKLEEFLGRKIVCTYPDENLTAPLPPLTPEQQAEMRKNREHRQRSDGRQRRR
jgi:ATP-dependent RNA helicase RhlB